MAKIPQPSSKMDTAVHEAAHARIALHFGFEPEIWVESDPAATRRTGVMNLRFPDEQPGGQNPEILLSESSAGRARQLDSFLLAMATIYLAGRVAERLFHPDADETTILE